MNRGGNVIWITYIFLIVLGLGAGIYLYNFHVLKTVRVCVGDAKNIEVPCSTTNDCVDVIKKDIGEDFGDAPKFLQEKIQEIIDESVYCEGTCFVKDIRGVNFETREFEFLDSCELEEGEISIEIRGKDGFEIWRYIESKK